MNALRPFPLVLLLALAGCSWFGGGEDRADPPAETRPDYVACRNEARNSPEMRTLGEQANLDYAKNATRLGPARAQTEERLYRDCLRRKGLALPGGVESVRAR